MSKTKVECRNCKVIFEKSNSEINRKPNHYCSMSCAAKYNNKLKPKRQLEGKCITCQSPIHAGLLYCSSHRSMKGIAGAFRPTKTEWYSKEHDRTIAETEYTNGSRSNAFARIRDKARTIAKACNYFECCICGYDLHFEVAHIKPINGYPKDTRISIVNDPNNLAPLCPNCHWEFDHGFITENELRLQLEEYSQRVRKCGVGPLDTTI